MSCTDLELPAMVGQFLDAVVSLVDSPVDSPVDSLPLTIAVTTVKRGGREAVVLF